MYLVCWTEGNLKDWVLVSGYDAMQVFVSELIEGGVKEEDIVCGEQTEDTV